MNFLLISVGFLSAAAGLPFPQEFLSPPSRSDNNRGFRVEQGSAVTKVVNGPSSSQRTQESFHTNQHFYSENEEFHKENYPSIQQSQQPVHAVQFQDVPQRIQYALERVPENIPHLLLPAQQVTQVVEQIPQGVHQSIQRGQRVPQRNQIEIPVPHTSILQPATQDVVQQGVHEITQPSTNIREGGQQLISEQHIHVQSHQNQNINQGSQETYRPTQNIQPAETVQKITSTQNIPQEQRVQQGNSEAFQNISQSEKQYQQEHKVQQAPQETPKSPQIVQQQTPEVQQASYQQNSPKHPVDMVQHVQNGVHVIRQEYSGQQQPFVQQNGQQATNFQSQNSQKIENISPVQEAPQIIQQHILQVHRVPEGQVTHIVPHGFEGLQTTRQREYIQHQQQVQPFPIVQPPQIQGMENTIPPIQHVPESVQKYAANVRTDQREQVVRPVIQYEAQGIQIVQQGEHNDKPIEQTDQRNVPTATQTTSAQTGHQAVSVLQHGPSGVNIIRQQANKEQHQRVLTSQVNEEFEAIRPAQVILPAVFQGEGVEKAPAEVQMSQGAEVRFEQPILTHVKQIPHVSHFSFGVPSHSPPVAQEPEKMKTIPQEVLPPQIPEHTSDVQILPPLLQKGAQNVVTKVPQVSQTIKEASHEVDQFKEQQANPLSEKVHHVYQGIRNSVHPSILSSAEAFVNAIPPQQLQVLRQVQQQEPSQQNAPLEQENRQLPSFHPSPSERDKPARPQYGSRKPVQSADDEADMTPIPIIRYENSVSPDGTYQWSYESGNGIKAQESGLLRNRGDPDKEAIAVQGSYSYTGPDNKFYSVEYISGPNGFQPLGRHLPTQPPLPEALQKAIDEHMAILATAEPDPDEQKDEPGQTDNKLSAPQRQSD